MQINKEKFDEIYEQHKDKLSKFVFSILKDYDEVQSIVQITFVKLLNQDFSLVEDRITPWLFTVARNTALKHVNKTKRLVAWKSEEFDAKPAECIDPRDALISKEQQGIDFDKLHTALNSLSERSRKILELRYFSNMSYEEIAATFNLSQGNVGFIINKAKNALKVKFKLRNKNDRKRKTNSGKSKNRDTCERGTLAGVADSTQSSEQG